MIEHELKHIRLEDIEPGERYRKNYHNMEKFVESIKEKGVIQPIAVMTQDDGRYLLLAGGRRFAGSLLAQKETIPAHVYPILDELTRREIELIENIEREDMTYVESAELAREIHRLEQEKHGKATPGPSGSVATMQRTGELLNKSRTLVAQEIELANAMDIMPELRFKKNKSEAMKSLRNYKANLVREELAKRVEKSTSKHDVARQQLNNSYIIGDFFEKIKSIPDNSFHMAEIDPPYGIDLHGNKKDMGKDMEEYSEIEADNYPDFLKLLCAETYRVLKANSWMLLWFAPDPWFTILPNIIRSVGFDLYSVPGLWYRNDGSGQTNQPHKRLASVWEPFFYARKGEATMKLQGRNNVFPYPRVRPEDKIHPTERPIELIEDLLSIFGAPGSRLLVPFAGSGNTLLAAANMKMQAVGFDLSNEYREDYILRVAERDPGQYRSYKG